MKFSIHSVIGKIPFSFPDPKDLRNKLSLEIRKELVPSSKFIDKYNNANLAFIIVLEKRTKELEIKGPSVDNELVDYAIWLPYNKIKKSKNYRLAYLENLESSFLEIFKKYDFDIEGVNEIFNSMKDELKE